MTPVRALLYVSLLVSVAAPAGAILQRAGEHIHDVGTFRLFMTNIGVVGNPTYPSFSDHPSLEWPAGSANEFLLEAGLWVGARNRAGSLLGVSTSGPVHEFRPSLDPVDRIYTSFDGDQGTRRFGAVATAAEADDDQDGRFDEEFLNGKDDDGDGLVDEDFVALGSQAFGCEYRDDTPEAREQLLAHRPLLLKVEQLSFAWSQGIDGLDQCAVLRYRVHNTGSTLYDVYLGFYVDPDVGPKNHASYWRDDRYSIETVTGQFPARGEPIVSGCEQVPFEVEVAVVEDVPDGEPGANGGDAEGLIAGLILDHTTNRWGFRAPDEVGPLGIVHLGGRVSTDRRREELSDTQKYDLMASGAFMGDNRTDDHRYVLIAGPFSELPAGESLEMTVALVVAGDRDDLAASVTALMERFHGRWIGGGPSGGNIEGLETCLTSDDSRFCNVNPFMVDHDCSEVQTKALGHAGCFNLASGIERVLVSRTGCTPVDFDCDRCTPNVSGSTTLTRWADTDTRISSRPVQKRVTPGDRETLIEWDNAAELPTARRTLPPVAGYRVWRASQWDRPPGSSGPEAHQWSLVAELPLPGSGLPAPSEPFVVDGIPVVDTVPGPEDSLHTHFDIGRYRYLDRGVANGFVLFYDVTPFAIEPQTGGTMILRSLEPRASLGEEVFPIEAGRVEARIRVVPNPYEGQAAWDLQPNRTDPSGRRIAFTGLPTTGARIDVYTLAGDRVRRIDHADGSGTAYWDLLSRNGQPVTSGVYYYTVIADGTTHQGKLVIIR